MESETDKIQWIREHYLDLEENLDRNIKHILRQGFVPFELLFRRGYQAGWKDAKSGMKEKRIG